MIFHIKKLEKKDICIKIVNLYYQLTKDNNIKRLTLDDIHNWLATINQQGNQVLVLHRIRAKVGSGNDFETIPIGLITILFDYKLIHGLCKVAHLEDVILDPEFRSMGLGQSLVKAAIKVAQKEKCYKIILNCKAELTNFYSKLGFKQRENQMSIYFDSTY